MDSVYVGKMLLVVSMVVCTGVMHQTKRGKYGEVVHLSPLVKFDGAPDRELIVEDESDGPMDNGLESEEA